MCAEHAQYPPDPLGDARSIVAQQLAQNGTMTTVFLLAIAADGKVAAVRQRGQQLDIVTRLWLRHLRSVLLHERRPLSRGARAQTLLQRLCARRKIGKPDIVPVPRCELRPGHTTRRTPHGTDPQPFTRLARAAQAYDTHAHVSSPSIDSSTIS